MKLLNIINVCLKEKGVRGTMEQEEKEFTLNDVFDEVWKHEHKDDKNPPTERDKDSLYRKQLNEMLNNIFGYGYGDILTKEGKGYKLGINTKKFMVFLLKKYAIKGGKKLRNKKGIGRKYENKLLYRASLFLEERKNMEEDVNVKTDDLKKRLITRFKLNEKQFQSVVALKDFTNNINKIIYSDDIHNENVYKYIAENLDLLADYMLSEVSKMPENSEMSENPERFMDTIDDLLKLDLDPYLEFK